MRYTHQHQQQHRLHLSCDISTCMIDLSLRFQDVLFAVMMLLMR
jgi:hypothetical protein